MEREEALSQVTEVTVSASEKKQLDDFEPAEAYVQYKAEVPEDIDPRELREELSEAAQEDAKTDVLRRWEEYIRSNTGDSDE